ncbi:trehalase [Aphelenchoides avenae]|nr:trehalase [Aphelenchus avenae]
MAINYRLASDFHRILGNEKKAVFYHNLYENLVESITIFWDNGTGAWYDYDLETKALQKRFYPTNVFPLLLKRSSNEVCEQIMDYLNATGVLKYQGGIPSSLEPRSREQWDFPNGWAPWNHLFIESLRTCKSPRAQLIARHVARNFTRDVFNGLFSPGKGLFPGVWEKYDVRYADGRSGFGGEYPVQLGFGWTNGAVLDLIRIYYTANGNKDKTAHLKQVASPSQLYSNFKHSVADMSIHGFIVAFLVVFCVIIAIWFTYSTFFPRPARRQGDQSWTDWERASGQPDDTSRLMDKDTE